MDHNGALKGRRRRRKKKKEKKKCILKDDEITKPAVSVLFIYFGFTIYQKQIFDNNKSLFSIGYPLISSSDFPSDISALNSLRTSCLSHTVYIFAQSSTPQFDLLEIIKR